MQAASMRRNAGSDQNPKARLRNQSVNGGVYQAVSTYLRNQSSEGTAKGYDYERAMREDCWGGWKDGQDELRSFADRTHESIYEGAG